jgi:putative ABC transport system permease protein
MRWIPFEYAARNLGRAPRRLAASVLGATLLVFVVLVAAGFIRGMERSLSLRSAQDNVMILGAGSEDSVERSQISNAVAGIASASVSGIRERLGIRYVSPELHLALIIRTTQDSPLELHANFRGITETAFLVHPEVRIIEGTAPRSGHNEVMVGRMAASRLGLSEAQLGVGSEIWFDQHPWKIVGQFAAPGTVMESELWTPLSVLQASSKNEALSCVIITADADGFSEVEAFCKQRLDLEIIAMREAEYYSKLLDFFQPIRILVWVTAALVAIGGLFGSLTTLYATFASRVREIATLQTLGYSHLAILMSLVQESALTAAAGALVACVIGVTALDGVAVRFSMGAFGLSIDERVVATGLVTGLLVGIIGALPPAWRALSLPIPTALRSSV